MTPQQAFTQIAPAGSNPMGYYEMELDREGYVFTVWVMAYKVELALTDAPDDGDFTDQSHTAWRESTDEFIRLTDEEYDRAHDVIISGYRKQCQDVKDGQENQDLEEWIDRNRE